MRFLCLHGMGTNNQVFQMQTASLRYELGDHHKYDFVEGTVPSPIAPEIQTFFAANDAYFSYFDSTSATALAEAVDMLARYVAIEGPFDGVIGFSQGALLAATLIARHQQHPFKSNVDKSVGCGFRCAIFLSGDAPFEHQSLLDGGSKREGAAGARRLVASHDGEMIGIPTAHIWGAVDSKWPDGGARLRDLCKGGAQRAELIHEGGHEVPGSKAKGAVHRMVHVVRQTVDCALYAQ